MDVSLLNFTNAFVLSGQAIASFLEVWGTGTATAEKWYAMGLRKLEDLRIRGDINLTEQQRVR